VNSPDAGRLADVTGSPLIRRRGDRIWGRLEGERIEAIVVFGHGVIGSYGYLAYTSGYAPVVRAANVVLFPDADPVAIVATGADAWYARNRAGLADVRVAGEGDILSEYDDLGAGVAALLAERGAAAGRIGVVGMRHAASAWEAERLRALLPAAELVDVTPAVTAVKAVKDTEDITELEATAAIADEAFVDFLAQLHPGMTGWEANGVIESAARSRGVKDALIFVSAGAYFLERPTAEPFADGDLLTVYVEIIGPTGYWIELARLVALGGLDADRTAIASACLEAARSAEALLVAGRSAGDAARAIDDVAERAGVRVGIWHGHGVGIDHDAPVVTAGDATPLERDMVIALHPNFSTADERLGASVADTYVIGAGAPRRLSRVDPGLIQA
jgi:Xaa-Pro aminopeptidase